MSDHSVSGLWQSSSCDSDLRDVHDFEIGTAARLKNTSPGPVGHNNNG